MKLLVFKKGQSSLETYQRTKLLMEELDLKEEDRAVVVAARQYVELYKQRPGVDPDDNIVAAALELSDGTIVTGRGSELMTATAACLLNGIKRLANINDELHLLSPISIDPMYHLKKDVLKKRETALNSSEVLMALAISAATNTMAALALKQLNKLKACQAHVTAILNRAEKDVYRSLGIDVSSDPIFMSKNLYYES